MTEEIADYYDRLLEGKVPYTIDMLLMDPSTGDYIGCVARFDAPKGMHKAMYSTEHGVLKIRSFDGDTHVDESTFTNMWFSTFYKNGKKCMTNCSQQITSLKETVNDMLEKDRERELVGERLSWQSCHTNITHIS